MRDSTNPRLAIGQISITGVDPVTARQIAPAIERALGALASEDRIAPSHRPRLTINVPHGASERDVAAALARALTSPLEQR